MAQGLKIIGDGTGNEESCGTPKVHLSSGDYELPVQKFSGRAAVITLGCAKNQVDSEVMIGVLKNRGYEIVDDVARADVAVVNTCGFLESAVKESIDRVLDLSELKRKGSLRKLIVAGCMVERYKGDLRSALPEADAFLTTDQLLEVGRAVSNDDHFSEVLDSASRPYFLYDESTPRFRSGNPHFAYIKISEGCNRPCTFCIIPKIRGAMRSRSIDSVVREVELLGQQGVSEVNLVAQDLTNFGVDTGGGDLVALLRKLDAAKAVKWIRLLYAYPVGVTEELLDTIMELDSVCKYIDIPLQHSSLSILKAMKRPLGRLAPRPVVDFIKTRAPEIQIRTTFIVGFPGETKEDVNDLASFVGEGHFSSVGVFTYSREQGTPSYDIAGHRSEKEKRTAREKVMLSQQKVALARAESLIGKEFPVLVEGTHEDTDLLLSARTDFQAPEVDGCVMINDIAESITGDVSVGHFGRVLITETSGYDLVGKLIA